MRRKPLSLPQIVTLALLWIAICYIILTGSEQAIDYKNMKQISAIFEIYKTKCEQYFNEHGRNWRQMFKDYVNKRNAEKKAQGKK